jgi:hypothetical protein
VSRWWLFARSRRLPGALAALALLALAGTALGTAQFRPHEESEYGIPWVVLVPVLMACVVAVSTESPFPDFDATRSRPLAPARGAHVMALLATAALGTWWTAHSLPAPFTEAAALRNLALLCGLGLLGTVVVAPSLAWVAPLTYGTTVLLVGNETGRVRGWAWLLMPDNSHPATVAALVCFLAGMAAAILWPSDKPLRGQRLPLRPR